MGNVNDANRSFIASYSEPVTMGTETVELKRFEDPDGQIMPLLVLNDVMIPPIPGLMQNVLKIRDFQFRDDDVILTTFPRSGTHFTWEIIHMLKQGSAKYIEEEKETEFLEVFFMNGMADKPDRVVNTHLPPELLPLDIKNHKCKIIHVFRNPKDVLVSMYNHWMSAKELTGYKGTFSGFFELAMKGQVGSGSWFDYELKFEEFFKANPGIKALTLSFEDLKQDPVSSISMISDFLELPKNDELIAQIADAVSFKKMKAAKLGIKSDLVKNFAFHMMETFPPETVEDLQTNQTMNKMYRKGEAGDWKNWFTVAQNERYEAEFERRMANSSLKSRIKWQV